MNFKENTDQIEMLYVIVNHGAARKILSAAKQLGISNGTVLLAKGTARSRLLALLELGDIRKEVVLMLAKKPKAQDVLQQLTTQFQFTKPNHGIAFTIPLNTICGVGNGEQFTCERNEGEETGMHQAIFVIVDKGKAEYAIEAASQAGARGGTVMHGRGSGAGDTSMLFSVEVEPEKEIALIIAEKQLTPPIVDMVVKKLELDKPGNGIVFVQDVSGAYGLY